MMKSCLIVVTYFIMGGSVGTLEKMVVLSDLPEKNHVEPFPSQSLSTACCVIDLSFVASFGEMEVFAAAFAVYEVDEAKAAESY